MSGPGPDGGRSDATHAGSLPDGAGPPIASSSPGPATDLRGVIATLTRQRWLILAATAASLAVAAVWLVAASPTYEVEAEILLEPHVQGDEPEEIGRALLLDQELETQLRLLTSDVVLSRATDALGLGADAISDVQASLIPETRVIVVTVQDTDPERAVEIAGAVTDEYLTVRGARATELLSHQRDEAEQQVEAAIGEVERLDEAIADAVAQDETFEPALQAERFSAVQILNDARARLTAIEGNLEATTTGGEVIAPATVPDDRVSPPVMLTLAVALVVGLGLGVVVALLRDTLDESVRTDEAVSVATGRPVLGRMPTQAQAPGAPISMQRDPGSSDAEPYRDLRANLRFVDPDLHTLAVSSSSQGDGKSTVAANLVVAAALAGHRVALVDGDLRRPVAHRLLGVADGIGLGDVLVGDATLADALVEVGAAQDGEAPLSLLPAGKVSSSASELLGAPQLAEVVDELRAGHDLVVIDTPSALAAPDAQEVASLTDATLLVATHATTRSRALSEATQRLERAGARIVGTVVTRVDVRDTAYADLPRPQQPTATGRMRAWLLRW